MRERRREVPHHSMLGLIAVAGGFGSLLFYGTASYIRQHSTHDPAVFGNALWWMWWLGFLGPLAGMMLAMVSFAFPHRSAALPVLAVLVNGFLIFAYAWVTLIY